MSKNRKLALSLSSWFCVPEQGMKDFEILCRASAFLVKSKPAANFASKYHVLSVSHAVAPWRWPKYYPDEWIQCVNEKHTHYTVELRHNNGQFMTQSDLLPISYHHATRDLAVLHLDNEAEVLKILQDVGVETGLAANASLPGFDIDALFLPSTGQALTFYGHAVDFPPLEQGNFSGNISSSGSGSSSNGTFEGFEDRRVPLPREVSGVMTGRTGAQSFAQTSSVLVDGMCGGPVVVKGDSGNSSNSGNSSRVGNSNSSSVPQLVGLVEGIVPTTFPDEQLQGQAVFVEFPEILQFLSSIEDGSVEREQGGAKLTGGEAERHVGADQDPEKMDWTKVI